MKGLRAGLQDTAVNLKVNKVREVRRDVERKVKEGKYKKEWKNVSEDREKI